MEKRGRVPKEKGRPRKTKKQKLVNADALIQLIQPFTNASSPGTASATLDGHMVTRHQTRNAKARADERAALNSPARILFQNDDTEKSSETSTLPLVKQILFGSNSLDTSSTVPMETFPSKSPGEAQDLHKNISLDQSVGAENQPKNVLDLKKFTLDLLAHAQQTELHIRAASSYSDDIMVNNIPPVRETNVVSNIFPLLDYKSSENKNEIVSNPTNPFIDVNRYKVKQESAPLLAAIFRKYGDIARDSTFSMESRSILLELVCRIYKRLEASTFMELTPLEIQSMVDQIRDLQLVKVEVGWLCKRLEQIVKAREMYDGVSSLEDVEERSVLVIYEKKKKVKTRKKELKERVEQEKDELAMALALAEEIKELYGGSLVHGLI